MWRTASLRSAPQATHVRTGLYCCRETRTTFANSLCRMKKNTFILRASGSQFTCAPHNIYYLIIEMSPWVGGGGYFFGLTSFLHGCSAGWPDRRGRWPERTGHPSKHFVSGQSLGNLVELWLIYNNQICISVIPYTPKWTAYGDDCAYFQKKNKKITWILRM